MDRDDGVCMIRLATQHTRKLSSTNAPLECGEHGIGLRDCRLVVLARSKVEQHLRIIKIARKALDNRNSLFERGPLSRDLLCFF